MQHPSEYATALLVLALVAGSMAVWAALLPRLLQRRTLVAYEPRALVPWTASALAVLSILALLMETAARKIVMGDGDITPTAVPPAMFAAISISRLLWLLLAIGYLMFFYGTYADDLGIDGRNFAGDLRLGFLGFLAAVLPVYGSQLLMTQVIGYKSLHPIVQLAQDQRTAGVMLLITFTAVVVAPLVEEFFLRILIQGWFEKKLIQQREWRGIEPSEPAGWLPIVISAAIFGLLHAWPDCVSIFLLGLFLGYVYQRTHRLLPSLVMHGCVNGVAVLELWRAFLAGTSPGT